jgi:predicted RNase H-like HicB family nuclease
MDRTYTYTIHLEPAEEGGYVVTVPVLPAIVTEGDTYEEAVAMARDAIECYLESLAKEGRPIPKEEAPPRPVEARIQVQAPATT